MEKTASPRYARIFKKIRAWLKAHLIAAVIVSLTASWIGSAYWVYRFEDGLKDANIHSLQDSLWWGIVTFLTVGYGDRYPVSTPGRVTAALLMLVGVVTMSIVTAKISSYFLEQALNKGRRTVDTDKLRDHFVICGWKEDMEDLLEHILLCNPDLEPKDLVIIAPLSTAFADGLKQHATLSEVQYVIGDFIHESSLRRAAPQRARRVLILADQSPSPTGQVPSESEVDARTIMAAMTLSQIARGTLVAAEIYDPKMDHYLKIAGVSEVIYTREYSRLILGNATAGTGIANVLYEILAPNTPVKILTSPIPENLFGQTFADLKKAWAETHPSRVVLGILENTGNSDSVRNRALRNAQKTANMNQLVQNLKGVKSLRFNHPVFPNGDYVINEGSLAIILESQAEGAATYEQPRRIAA